MKSFYDKEDYNIEDLQSLIDNQVEESIYLDFKSAGSLEKNDKKRAELSKDVASFANSDGGIIIYGIKEVDHVASEYSFIDGNEFTKEWIETIINSYVQRRISDVKIYPIRIDGDLKKSIYIVKIPYSYDAPHLSKDNRYYKRYNFMSVPMEEYEIRHTYNRLQQTNLEIEDVTIKEGGSLLSGGSLLVSAKYNIGFEITNIGNTIEKLYKVEINMPSAYLANQMSNSILKHRVRTEGNRTVFSVACPSPIFQSERTTVVTADIEFFAATEALIDEPITIKLYYSNCIKSRDLSLKDKLFYRGVPLNEWNWRI